METQTTREKKIARLRREKKEKDVQTQKGIVYCTDNKGRM